MCTPAFPHPVGRSINPFLSLSAMLLRSGDAPPAVGSLTAHYTACPWEAGRGRGGSAGTV